MNQITIPNSMLTDLLCPKCSGKFFYPVFALKHYPGGLHSVQPVTFPVQLFRCVDCLHVITPESKTPKP